MRELRRLALHGRGQRASTCHVGDICTAAGTPLVLPPPKPACQTLSQVLKRWSGWLGQERSVGGTGEAGHSSVGHLKGHTDIGLASLQRLGLILSDASRHA